MNKLLLGVCFFKLLALVTSSFMKTAVKEYCQMETFKPQCGADEVIVIQHARYGRMRKGHCVTVNYGNIGCVIDVRSYLDTLCSGRQTCEVKIPDDRMFNAKPCPKDVTAYLEASYQCQKVHLGDEYRGMCRNDRRIRITDREGYISSLSAVRDRVGSSVCPWFIEAPPGQRINLTLYDFGKQTDPGNSAAPPVPFCQRYGLVFEEGLPSETTICSSRRRQRHIYTSDSNQIKIQLLHDRHKQDDTNFMIRYTVIGCKDPPLHGASLVSRTETRAILKCNRTGEQWHLTCTNGDWSGQRTNCTLPGAGWSVWKVLTEEWSTPYGILVTVGLGVTLGIIIGILLLVCVLVFLKRRHALKPPEEMSAYGTNAIVEGDDALNQKWDQQADYRLGRGGVQRGSGPYAQVWDPESAEPDRTDVNPALAAQVDSSNILARQYGIPRDLLTESKPLPHQYGIYDRRTDHVYEKPT